jgi:hypothetical protein
VSRQNQDRIARIFGVLAPEPPRDEAGRFVKPPPGSFDGGARVNPPAQRDPATEHAALLTEAIAAARGRASAGRTFTA